MIIKKYLGLLCKDLLICKNVAIFSLMSILFPFFLPKEILISSFYIPAIMILVYTTFLTAIIPLWQEEKNNGLKLLLITSCTRFDIVICRYLAILIVNLINLILYFGTIFLITKELLFISFPSIIIFLILCSLIAVLIPITFKFKAMIASIIVGIAISPLLVYFQLIKIENIYSILISVGIIVFSILLIILSIIISLKIYRNIDL